MAVILFIICLLASTFGAIAGFGGGVIIKPVLDALGLLEVSTVSFLSGCTVLAMSVSSLIRNRNDGVKLKVKTSTPLAIGAAAGGIIGKFLFQIVKDSFGNENVLGLIQAIVLIIVTIISYLYMCKKDSMKSYNVTSIISCAIIGAVLGIISSFLGIGGGPCNIAVLFFFFSMNAKEAAKNSIYVIMFSQIASISNTIIDGSVPSFQIISLIFMALGGVGGAIIGGIYSKKLDNKSVEKIVKILLFVIIIINIYNIIKFSIRI